MSTSHYKGHKVWYSWDAEAWILPTGKPIGPNTPCVRCERKATPEGYDACLGYIENVTSACCGHGAHKPIRKFRAPSD